MFSVKSRTNAALSFSQRGKNASLRGRGKARSETKVWIFNLPMALCLASSLRLAKVDGFSIKPVFGRADFAAANHRFPGNELATGDKSHGPASRAGHDGNERVLGMTQGGLVFKDENRTGVHSFGNPFFQKLQVG
jgi:hypothetical protein